MEACERCLHYPAVDINQADNTAAAAVVDDDDEVALLGGGAPSADLMSHSTVYGNEEET